VAGARSGAQRKDKEEGNKEEKEKEKGEKEGRRKRKKDLEELEEEVLGKIRREGRRDFCGVFRFFGCWRNFRGGGDGEAGRPAGPR
jgi:hypothetical protein